MKSDKRPFLTVKKWDIGKIALKCEEWSLKIVENGLKWRLSMKSASSSATNVKPDIHGKTPISASSVQQYEYEC